jgi:hypothetical protein
MKTRHASVIGQTLASLIGCTIIAGVAASANAASVIVTDITDWTTTPMELVNADLPELGYAGFLYAGINTLSVTIGPNTTVDDAFCIDPFHWSVGGPTPGYAIVPLSDAPKLPGTLNPATALEIEDLWAEFFSPTMSSSSAAGLQVAIWELVSSNAVATGELPASEAVTFSGNTFGAGADLASLATYDGPAANLAGLTGPGQDYIIDMPSSNAKEIPSTIPDGGGTFIMLVLTLSTLFLARSTIIERAGQLRKAQAIPVDRRLAIRR